MVGTVQLLHKNKNSKRILDPTSKYKSIQVFKYENIKCMQSFKFAILEFDYLLTNDADVKARDPVGSKNIGIIKIYRSDLF